MDSALGVLFIENGTPVPHDYVVTLTNYNMRADSDFLKHLAKERVRKSVVDLLFDVASDTSQRIATFIRTNRDNIPDDLSDEAAQLFIRGSVRVEVLEIIVPGVRALTPVYNVYIYPPTANKERLDRWREWIAIQKYHASHNGVGVRYQFRFRCNHCKTIDHPSGLCPHTRARRGGTDGGNRGEDDDELLPLNPKNDPGPSGSRQNPPTPGPSRRGGANKGNGNAPDSSKQQKGKGGNPKNRAPTNEGKKRRMN